MSLDGVIQAPGDPAEDRDDGIERGGLTGALMDEHTRYNGEPFRAAGAVLLSRRTYEIWAEDWPTVSGADEIARALNSKPKHVASTTLNRPDWHGTTILPDGLPAEIEGQTRVWQANLDDRKLDLAQTLIEHDLVDEYQLWLPPVVPGGGKRLFRHGNPVRRLRLVDTRTTRGGRVILTFGRAEQESCDPRLLAREAL